MAIKELQTRIQLKYDSYENWKDSELVLLPGEIGLCEIPGTTKTVVEGGKTVQVTTAPTVLFKVGNANKTPFKDLPWASAKAADVYGWAKAATVEVSKIEGKEYLVFKDAAGTEIADSRVDLSRFALAADVKDTTDGLASRIATLEGKFGDNGDVTTTLADHESRLGAIEGDTGAIATGDAATLQAAKDYADGLAGNYDAAGSAATAEQNAKAYADGLDKLMDGRVDTLEAAKADHETRISNNAKAIGENTQAIADEVAAREAAIGAASTADKAATGIHAVIEAGDKAINDKIGTLPTDYTTVVAGIAAAKQAGLDAAQDVADLAAGQVATNKADIADLAQDLADEASARADADTGLDNRLKAVEAFFVTKKDEEGNDIALDEALDTLVEIQEYITGDGAAAKDMLDAIEANADAIEALQDIVKDGGTLEVRVDDLESRASAVEGRAKTLEDIVDGYTAKGSIKTAIEAAAELAQTGVNNAATAQEAAEAAQDAADAAQDAADKAQGEVDALEGVVAGVKSTADTAASDLAALVADTGRIKAAENAIDALELVVNDASKGNDKLRTDVNALQTLTSDAAKGNAALYTELTRVAGLVDNSTTGLAATKAIADEAKSDAEDAQARVAAIENDYVKASDLVGDFYIFNCGSSTKVTHEAPAAE